MALQILSWLARLSLHSSSNYLDKNLAGEEESWQGALAKTYTCNTSHWWRRPPQGRWPGPGQGRLGSGSRQPQRGQGTKGTCLTCASTSATCPSHDTIYRRAGVSPRRRCWLTALVVEALQPVHVQCREQGLGGMHGGLNRKSGQAQSPSGALRRPVGGAGGLQGSQFCWLLSLWEEASPVHSFYNWGTKYKKERKERQKRNTSESFQMEGIWAKLERMGLWT
nr:uncharacterized protein LOC123287753 [Equus asinus]